MATEDKRIDQLDPVSVLDLTSLMAMQQGTSAKKVTLEQLLNYLNANVDTKNTVLYVSQTLTEGQQAQARKNIRCGSVGEVSDGCEASGDYAHAEGYETKATGVYSHTEGKKTTATGNRGPHAEGELCIASGDSAHAEGYKSEASEWTAHAEGGVCKALGKSAHAEGNTTTAEGTYSHSEGVGTKAIGKGSHAEGGWTTAASDFQHVQGHVNKKDTEGKYLHIVGNGSREALEDGMYLYTMSNAHTLDWDGVPWFNGRAQCLGNAQDDGAQTVMLNGDTEITLTDRTTGVKCNLYIDNGKLMMEVVS